MLDRLFHQQIHEKVYLTALFGLAVGLSTSLIVLSLSTMLLSLNFLLEGNYKAKILRLYQSKLGLLILAFYLLHFLAMLWSSNLDYGWHDLKGKLPLLAIPTVVFASKPLKQQYFNWVLGAFVLACLITSITNYVVFAGRAQATDFRELSLFGSHIRYSLLIVFALCICLWQLIVVKKQRIASILLVSWFAYYTLYAEVVSGYLCLFFALIVLCYYLISTLTKRKQIALLGFSTVLVAGAILIVYLSVNVHPKEQPDWDNLPSKTINGNLYTHTPELKTLENGYYVFLYECPKEVKKAWNDVSDFPVDSLDKKGQPIYLILIRYMTSKGLRKDSLGFTQMTTNDIRNVENGIPSIAYLENGLTARLNKIRWELSYQNSPNGHSLLQRFEYWKAALHIIQNNCWMGVGTGDVNDSFLHEYERENSPLSLENRLRAHQQFLTSWISFGIVGFLLFVLIHIVFIRIQWKNKNLLGFFFAGIILISYLSEDTLETLVGVTFFSLFIALLSIEPVEEGPNVHG